MGTPTIPVSNNSDPINTGVAIVPSDSTVLPTTRAILVGGAGNLVVVWADGTTETLYNLNSGMIYPFRVTKVKAATTATFLTALY